MTKQSNSKGNLDSGIRSEVVSIGKHSMVYVVGQALSRAVGFLMIPVYTHYISPTNFGAMELIEILTTIVLVTISLEVGEVMSRHFYAEKEDQARDRVVSTILIGLGALSLPAMLLFLWLSKYFAAIIFDSPQYQYYLQVSIASAWFGMLREVGYSYLRMRYMAKSFVAVTILHLILSLSLNIYFVVIENIGILGIFYSTLISQGVTAFVLVVWILTRIRLSVSIPLLRSLILFGLPLVPSRIGLMLGFVSNRFFLRWFGSPDPVVALAEVGIFSLGHKFGVVVNRFFNSPFDNFWGPRRLELLLGDKPQAKETVARVCTYATLCVTYLALLLSSGIESLIEIMADSSYRGAHQVVPFVALAYVALGIEKQFSAAILHKRKTMWLTYVSVLGIGIVLIWNYLFVPIYGILGAVTSNLAGFVVRTTLIYTLSQRLYKIPFEIKRIGLILMVAFVLYGVSMSINLSMHYITFLGRVGFVALFPFILYLVGFFNEGELDFVKQALRRWRQRVGV